MSPTDRPIVPRGPLTGTRESLTANVALAHCPSRTVHSRSPTSYSHRTSPNHGACSDWCDAGADCAVRLPPAPRPREERGGGADPGSGALPATQTKALAARTIGCRCGSVFAINSGQQILRSLRSQRMTGGW